MTTMFLWIGAKFGVAKPFVFFWNAAYDSEVTLVHAAGFKKVAEGVERSLAFGKEQNARCFGVEAMDVFQEFEIARAGPKFAAKNGGTYRELEVATRSVPTIWDEHPASGFVHGEYGAIFVKDWDGNFIPELNDIRPRHPRNLP